MRGRLYVFNPSDDESAGWELDREASEALSRLNTREAVELLLGKFREEEII